MIFYNEHVYEKAYIFKISGPHQPAGVNAYSAVWMYVEIQTRKRQARLHEVTLSQVGRLLLATVVWGAGKCFLARIFTERVFGHVDTA